MTRTTAAPVPSVQVQVQTGTGVDPAAIDHALDQVRAACTGYPVESVRVRVLRATNPARSATFLTDATAAVHGHGIRVAGTGGCPQTSIDQACDRLAAELHQASATH